ncbi:MAG: response regulator, partial [Sulfurimicrobium sp.]|nr:response regulator [Sulfurimicrobium sp.]
MPTILVVDDTPENILLLSELLQPLYLVRAASSGYRALQVAASDPRPDLILLDVMMPEMDGYEVIRQLQADARTAGIPVIFVTALESSIDEERGLALG